MVYVREMPLHVCRWFDYSRFGTPIGGTKIICVKTPLKKVIFYIAAGCSLVTTLCTV